MKLAKKHFGRKLIDRRSQNQLLPVSLLPHDIHQVKPWANTSHGTHHTTINHLGSLFPKIARAHPSPRNLAIALKQLQKTFQDLRPSRNNLCHTHLRVTQIIPRYLLKFQSRARWTSTLPNIKFRSIQTLQLANSLIATSAGRRISQAQFN